MELFTIPGVGGIIERRINGMDHILIQDRCKEGAPQETGLYEIPAGKIRQYENIFDCLRREVKEETGLDIVRIEGESDSLVIQVNGYTVVNYQPFNCSQNIAGYYPIMVQVFICEAEGETLNKSGEAKNFRWISLGDLRELIEEHESAFYPMHIVTLKKYLETRFA